MNAKVNSEVLSGVRVLVGRASHQASALSSSLRAVGAEVIEIPFIEIRPPRSYEPLDEALKKLHTYDWMILTSVNGVEAVFNRFKTLKLTGSQPAQLKVAAIGPATRNSIESHGFTVDVVPRKYVAESVVLSLRSRVQGKRVLLARAKVARDVIPQELRKAGAIVDVVEAYETVIPTSGRTRLQKLFANKSRRPHIITFTSSSAVKNFMALMQKDSASGTPKNQLIGGDDIQLASIGPITSGALGEMGLEAHIEAKQYTIPGLVNAIVSALRGPTMLQ